MSDWPDQITEFQRNWVEQQQKLLSDWLDSLKSTGGDSPRASWRKAADVMEQQIDSALDAQKQSLRAFAENLEKVEGAPETFTQGVKQLEEGIEQWADVQHQMWRVWFDMLRANSPTPQTPGETAMESWEDMVKQTMAVQEEWLSKWTDMTPASGKGSGKKSSGKKTSRKKSSGKSSGSS